MNERMNEYFITASTNNLHRLGSSAGMLGDQGFPPIPITGRSANTIPADFHLLQIFLEY